jgi:hypothetical protein
MPPPEFEIAAAGHLIMDANKPAHAAMSQADKLKYLEDRQKAQKPMQTVRYEMSEQEREEFNEYAAKHNLPF